MKKSGYKNKKKNNAAKPKKPEEKLRVINTVCAVWLAVILLSYFCDFFRLSVDGIVENGISGFRISFILFGDGLKDAGNVLSLVNKRYSGAIKFASAASGLSLLSVIITAGIFMSVSKNAACKSIFTKGEKKPLSAKLIIPSMAVTLVLLILQTAACGSLASVVTDNYYADCATCLARSLSFVPLILFIAMLITYFTAAYRLLPTKRESALR
jgi:hypothetical protein